MIHTVEVDGGFKNDCQLVVEVSGLDLSVKAGTVVNYTVERELAEDKDYTVTPSADYPLLVEAWLVLVKATDALDVLVDEIVDDGEDVRYVFDDESPYKKLRMLAYGQLPAGATSIDDGDFTIKKIVMKVPEAPRPERARPRVIGDPIESVESSQPARRPKE